jgi:hypothetical protein
LNFFAESFRSRRAFGFSAARLASIAQVVGDGRALVFGVEGLGDRLFKVWKLTSASLNHRFRGA